MVPTTAVKGSAANGVIWLVLPDGTTEERPVTLGMTDGTSVQILDGLAEGDLVNEFVPGAVDPAPDGCTTQPDGSVMCMGGGYAP
ncbi:hypothetical protein [Cryobacterium sp. MLB-32]|uniref:hypothetical protein n=1 Tax=Cryobacterium sp. MLB-32 TaxID=1529318 RepID=UPI001E5F64A3|nr:hypothetical protein [Cryobacterium sp. MLB-32]